jgi:hypothetical protein
LLLKKIQKKSSHCSKIQTSEEGTVRENDQKLWYNKYMRRERITYTGAYHHVMNRGYDGNDIFAGNRHKSHFLDYMEESAKTMKIRIFAYCIMTLHIIITTWFWKTPAAGCRIF